MEPPGHFGLAVRDYTHSTAPNRRFPDLITQRLVKAVLAGHSTPYSIEELEALALQCTRQEDNANKVERQARKSAAALVVESQVGRRFDAIVTGASNKGTWVRVSKPPIEGMLVRGAGGLDVGDRVRVRVGRRRRGARIHRLRPSVNGDDGDGTLWLCRSLRLLCSLKSPVPESPVPTPHLTASP